MQVNSSQGLITPALPNKMLTTNLKRNILIAAVALLPSILAICLPVLIWGRSILDFVPNSSDEIIYWREIKTFSEVGFGGGQYSTDERPAQIAASPFGSHGPAFVMLYGSLGRLAGWHEDSAVLIHLVLVPLALLIAITIAKPDQRQLVILGLLLVSWWPLQLYIPSNMQEVLHLSAAIILAALFYRFMTEADNKRKFAIAISLVLLFLIPFRFIWGFLVFPLIFFYPAKKNWKTWLLALIGTGLVLLAGVAFVRFFYSYYPWYSNELLDLLLTAPGQGIREVLRHIRESVVQLFSLDQGLPLVILVRYQLIGLLIATMAWFVLNLRTKLKDAWAEKGEALFHVVSLAGVLAFVLLFYDVLDTRDYRMFISPLLLSCILLLFAGRSKYVYPIIALNIVFAFSFLSYYPQYRYQNFHVDPELLRQVDQTINPYLQFDPSANRWCNTLSVSKYGDSQAIGYPLTTINSGFGITTILDWKDLVGQSLKARYVLLDPDSLAPDFGNLPNRFDLQELSETPIGVLYLNPQADC